MSWESNGKNNAYGNFTTLLEQQAVDIMRMPSSSGQERWQQDVSGETSSQYNVKLPNPPAADASFTQMVPMAFRPPEGMKGFGADLIALKSLPALEDKKEEPEAEFDFPDFDEELNFIK